MRDQSDTSIFVKWLLAGDNANDTDEEGNSILHLAVTDKDTGNCLLIIENGGCRLMGLKNSNNMTPLHICVKTYNVAVVRKWVQVATAVEIRSVIDIPSPLGSALFMAALLQNGHEKEGREIVKILLAAGANPVAQHATLKTVLHVAVMVDDVELVKIILDAGVDVNIRNKYGTPLDGLTEGAKCTELLQSAGAICTIRSNVFTPPTYTALILEATFPTEKRDPI